jgi:hypothetical protein
MTQLALSNIDELAEWALEQAGGAVRGPMLRALMERDPDLTRIEANAIVTRAFRLSGDRRSVSRDPDAGGVLPDRKKPALREEEMLKPASVTADPQPKPAPRRRRGPPTRAETEALHTGIRNLLESDPEITQRAAYEALGSALQFKSFVKHFQKIAGKRQPGRKPAALPAALPVTPEPETPEPEAPADEEIAPVKMDGDRVVMQSALGECSAKRVGPYEWEVWVAVHVGQTAMAELVRAGITALFPREV